MSEAGRSREAMPGGEDPKEPAGRGGGIRARGEEPEALPEGRGGLVWFGGFLLLSLINFVWEVLDTRPPVWDMAHHQMMGWRILDAWRAGEPLGRFVNLSDYYPPLYYLQEAFWILIVGASDLLPFATNLFGLFLLSYGTYRLGCRFLPPLSAAAAAWMTLMLPLVAWTGREALLDVSLSAWVVVSFYLALRSRWFRSRPWSLLFGLVGAAGMLTKWTYVLFVAPVIVYSIFRSRFEAGALRNLFDAALVSIPLTFWWYLPNFHSLVARFQLTSAGAGWEQDPGLDSLWGWLYYPRSLSSYYLFLPLTLILIFSLVRIYRRGAGDLERFLLLCGAAAILLLTLLEAKDPRYVMPVAPLAVLLTVSGLKQKRGWVGAVLGVTFLQYLAVSFPLPGVPEKVAFFSLEEDSDYVGMGREWVWFESNYFGVTGPPVAADWGYDELLEQIPPGARIGFVPDAPFFNPVTFGLMARRNGRRVETVRLGLSPPTTGGLGALEWVVGKTGPQGISYITRYNDEVYSSLESLGWRKVKSWHLPDAGEAILWRNPTPSR